jgi:hypothetical protein
MWYHFQRKNVITTWALFSNVLEFWVSEMYHMCASLRKVFTLVSQSGLTLCTNANNDYESIILLYSHGIFNGSDSVVSNSRNNELYRMRKEVVMS